MVCPHQNSCGLLDLSVGMLETGACWEVAVRERLCKASAAKMSEYLSLGEGSECVITHGDWLSYLTVTASKGCQVLHVLYTRLLFRDWKQHEVLARSQSDVGILELGFPACQTISMNIPLFFVSHHISVSVSSDRAPTAKICQKSEEQIAKSPKKRVTERAP